MRPEESLITTVNAFIDELTTERGFSVNTVAAYRNDLSQFAEYLQRPAVGGPAGAARLMERADGRASRSLSFAYVRDANTPPQPWLARPPRSSRSATIWRKSGQLREDPSQLAGSAARRTAMCRGRSPSRKSTSC